MEILRTPDERFNNLPGYNFEPHYVEIAGLGHEWATKQKINEQIWEFFDKHPRK